MASSIVAKVSASSKQANHPASDAADGNTQSFWVSNGTEPGNGPTRAKPEWLQWSFPTPTTIERFMVQGREGYGPRECELHASDDGKTFRTIKAFTANEKGNWRTFGDVKVGCFDRGQRASFLSNPIRRLPAHASAASQSWPGHTSGA